jgi:spectinomycin phosphotransferase
MLEKPAIPDEKILACLREEYGLAATGLAFLPIGADANAAVYRATVNSKESYFVKLRRGVFDEIAVTLPKFLNDQGIAQVLAPLPARTGRPWSDLDDFKVILYPYIEGRNGAETDLTDSQWRTFGSALKAVHTTVLPPALKSRISSETYSPEWRENVKKHLVNVNKIPSVDVVAEKTIALVIARWDEIHNLVVRAERLARILMDHSHDFVLCHSDVHEANILIGREGDLHIVDWDNPILAPKERDLMFIGGGIIGVWTRARQEELFYQGYGQDRADFVALAYYRFERIVQDISIFCDQLLLTGEGGDDREQSFRYLASNFEPGGVLEIANRTQYQV